MTDVDLGAKAFWSLIFLGAGSGAGSVWVFRRWSDNGKIKTQSNRLLAHLFEFQLFSGEPALILKAQRDLIVSNLQLLREIFRPTLALLIPYTVLLIGAEAFFGHAPLQLGRATVLTLQTRDDAWPPISMEVPAGIRIETPPVRIPREHQMSWRLRAIRDSSGELNVRTNEHTAHKSISARPGLQWLSNRRASFPAVVVHPFELPLQDGDIQSITLGYPAATVFGMHWIVWFSIGSLVGACAFLLTGL